MTEALTIDLHTHSNRSDGSLSPGDLVARAAAAGIGVLALTDHDTTAGLDEAGGAAAMAGIRLVPGIELSASWRAQAIHILGLWIDPAGAPLRARLESQDSRRRLRMRAISGSMASTSTVSGAWPARPSSTARSLAWPRPVAPSEP